MLDAGVTAALSGSYLLVNTE